MSSSALRAACRRLSPAASTSYRQWVGGSARHLHTSRATLDDQHRTGELGPKWEAAFAKVDREESEGKTLSFAQRVARDAGLNATGSVRKAIIENRDEAAMTIALADRWNRTMLHHDSLWPLLKRLADPISNYWAVVVATREVGLMGARHRRCKFDDGPAAMCGPCVMRHRNETQNDPAEKDHEPCFHRSLGGRAISCHDWQEWTYAALYCQLWVAGCAATYALVSWSLVGLEKDWLQFQVARPKTVGREFVLMSWAILLNLAVLEYARVWLAGTTYRAIGWRIVKYGARWRRYMRWL